MRFPWRKRKRAYPDIEYQKAALALDTKKAELALISAATTYDPVEALRILKAKKGAPVIEPRRDPMSDLMLEVVRQRVVAEPPSPLDQVNGMVAMMDAIERLRGKRDDDGRDMPQVGDGAAIAIEGLNVLGEITKPIIQEWVGDRMERKYGPPPNRVADDHLLAAPSGPSPAGKPTNILDRIKGRVITKTVLDHLKRDAPGKFAEWAMAIAEERPDDAGTLLAILIETPDELLGQQLQRLAADPANDQWRPVFEWLAENEPRAHQLVAAIRAQAGVEPPTVAHQPAPERPEAEVLDDDEDEPAATGGWL